MLELPNSKEPSELMIYSTLGEVVHQQKAGPYVDRLALDISAIPRGIYWLSVRRDDTYGTVKLLKQ